MTPDCGSRFIGDALTSLERQTMPGYEFTDIACPYCGETIEVAVDTSGGSQTYIEDCQVCCRPIVMRLVVDDGDDSFDLTASAENDG